MLDKTGVMMKINEKVALYEFCRSRFGKEYHNLTAKRKESVKKQYYKTKVDSRKLDTVQENRKLDLGVTFPGSFKELVFQS